MARFTIGKAAVNKIHAAVEALFGRAKMRLLARRPPKEIRISVMSQPVGVRDDLSIPGIFDHSSRTEGFKPSADVRESLTRVAEGYLDAHCELAKVKVLHAVQNFLSEAETKQVDTDLETVLGGELSDIFATVTHNVKTIVETESTRARNAGTLDSVTKIAAVMGVADPVVYFVIVRDQHVCSECVGLHQLNGTLAGPPKVYRLSEVGHGYHKRGESNPKLGGLHPHCRCSMVYLAKGFGFSPAGLVTFISPEWDEYAKQRGDV